MSAGATALLTGIDEMRRTPSSRDMRMIGEPRRWEAARLGWFDHHHDAPARASSVAPGGLRATPVAPSWPIKASILAMSALPPKADICIAPAHVRYEPKADSCTAARQRGYSITSSARPISVLGMLRPSVLAVLRLIINSTLV